MAVSSLLFLLFGISLSFFLNSAKKPSICSIVPAFASVQELLWYYTSDALSQVLAFQLGRLSMSTKHTKRGTIHTRRNVAEFDTLRIDLGEVAVCTDCHALYQKSAYPGETSSRWSDPEFLTVE